jgi:hypothetical protein
MKKTEILLFSCLLLISLGTPGYADVAFSTVNPGGVELSNEILLSYESPIDKSFSYLIWGGQATVISLLPPPVEIIPALGGEIGLEGRYYFGIEGLNGLNVSLYGGTALMFVPIIYGRRVVSWDIWLAFTPGIKETYKFNFFEFLSIEPYISLSFPLTFINISSLFDGRSDFIYLNINPKITIGSRFVFELYPWLNPKKSD